VNAFGNYTLTPNKAFFHFAPIAKTFTNLSNNQLDTNFSAARNTHSISGRVLNNQNQGLDGITVTVFDESNSPVKVTTTSGGGLFSFSSLPAGFNYKLTPTATPIFAFTTQTVPLLAIDTQLNFPGVVRNYTLSGSVFENNNQKLSGILLRLSGSRTALTRTDLNGNYSFTTDALGSYMITPESEQNFYSLSPGSQSVVANTSDRVFNFTASLRPFPNPGKVLEFDGSPKTVDHGNYWPAFTNLGHFFWEFWAMPGSNAAATYMISDGYGGLHAILFGVASFGKTEPGRYQLLGNINDGVLRSDHIFYFGSDQGPAVNEWGHVAVGWDGQNIITYFNGVPVGKTPYNRPRQSVGPGNGSGRLLIGGSDHSNFRGRIAQVRGYEGTNPREAISVESTFIPQTIFSREGNLLSYYFTAGPVVADLSRGYLTGNHVGVPRGTTSGILGDCGSCPPPQFVLDSTAPNFVTNTPPQPVSLPTPPGAPPGALAFDSFSRPNSTYTFGNKGGLGSTDSGSAGPQIWQTAADATEFKPFGILNGQAVLLGNETAATWVATGSVSGNLDIRVDRRPGNWGCGTNTGLSFRVLDHANYFFAYTTDGIASPGDRFLTVGHYLGGLRTVLTSGLLLPANWTTLRAVTQQSGSIQVFADSTLLYSTSNMTLATATNAGLYNNGPGLGLVNRWDNFRVFAVNP